MRSNTGGERPSEPTGARPALAPTRRSRAGLRVLAGAILTFGLLTAVVIRSEAIPDPPQAKAIAKADPGPVTAFDRPKIFLNAALDEGRSLDRLIAQRYPGNGEARDVYGIGDFTGAIRTLRIEARWRAKDAETRMPPTGTLFVDLAETAARMGTFINKMGVSESAPDGRTGLEWAHAELGTTSGVRECLAFRLTGASDKRMSGFLCAPPSGRLGEQDLSCLLDRVQLSANGMASGFDQVLRGAPTKHASCSDWIG